MTASYSAHYYYYHYTIFPHYEAMDWIYVDSCAVRFREEYRKVDLQQLWQDGIQWEFYQYFPISWAAREDWFSVGLVFHAFELALA